MIIFLSCFCCDYVLIIFPITITQQINTTKLFTNAATNTYFLTVKCFYNLYLKKGTYRTLFTIRVLSKYKGICIVSTSRIVVKYKVYTIKISIKILIEFVGPL